LRFKTVKVLFIRLDGVRLNLLAFSGRLQAHAKGEFGLAGFSRAPLELG
jgi:hypothetical protein